MIKHALLTLLCLTLVAGAGCARRPHPGDFNPRVYFEADFKKADTDQDESLTRDEAVLGMPSIGQRFDEIDVDKNERLNFAEVWSYVQWRRVANAPPGGEKPRPGAAGGPQP